jgi:hypothetical protein
MPAPVRAAGEASARTWVVGVLAAAADGAGAGAAVAAAALAAASCAEPARSGSACAPEPWLASCVPCPAFEGAGATVAGGLAAAEDATLVEDVRVAPPVGSVLGVVEVGVGTGIVPGVGIVPSVAIASRAAPACVGPDAASTAGSSAAPWAGGSEEPTVASSAAVAAASPGDCEDAGWASATDAAETSGEAAPAPLPAGALVAACSADAEEALLGEVGALTGFGALTHVALAAAWAPA